MGRRDDKSKVRNSIVAEKALRTWETIGRLNIEKLIVDNFLKIEKIVLPPIQTKEYRTDTEENLHEVMPTMIKEKT